MLRDESLARNDADSAGQLTSLKAKVLHVTDAPPPVSRAPSSQLIVTPCECLAGAMWSSARAIKPRPNLLPRTISSHSTPVDRQAAQHDGCETSRVNVCAVDAAIRQWFRSYFDPLDLRHQQVFISSTTLLHNSVGMVVRAIGGQNAMVD